MIKEFSCDECGNLVEIWSRFDPEPEICEECGGKMIKIISNTSFSLKGDGWYATEYGKLAKTKSKKVNSK